MPDQKILKIYTFLEEQIYGSQNLCGFPVDQNHSTPNFPKVRHSFFTMALKRKRPVHRHDDSSNKRHKVGHLYTNANW